MGLWLVFEKLTNGKPWICLDALPCSACQLSLFLSQVGQRPGYYIPQAQQAPRLDCVSIPVFYFCHPRPAPRCFPSWQLSSFRALAYSMGPPDEVISTY
jgi:hypothetical protein